MGVQDPNFKRLTTVDTVPTSGLVAVSGTVPSGSKLNVIITTTPHSTDLAIWNFLYSTYVDTDDVAYAYPDGVSLTSAQRTMRTEQWVDWARSNDQTNKRKTYFRIENYDTASHTYYVKFKAYTTVGAGGTSA